MNEQNPVSEWAGAAPSATPYRDRSVGLTIFGILTILLGVLSGLMVLLMLAGSAMSNAAARGQVNPVALLPAMAMYGGLAVALIWLGIGSILAQRWARALLLIFSWSWLVMGIFIVALMAVLMPRVLASLPSTGSATHPAMSPAALAPFMVVMLLIQGFFLVLLPAIWTFFYNSRHVKATCEARDPVARWTDTCPLPVLGLCLWILFSAVTLLIMPIAGLGVVPFFGIFLTGAPGAIFYLLMAALWVYAAWLLYRLDPAGWWLILVALALFTLSSVVTYSRHDVLEMYRLMGYPAAQVEQIQRMNLFVGNSMIWMSLASVLPLFGYLFFIKRYFRRE